MPHLHLPWLELSVLIPLLGAVYLGLLKSREAAYRHCIVLCGLTLFCAVGEWIDFGVLHAFEAYDQWDLFGVVLHQHLFVVDELSAPLLPLAALLYLMTVMSTLRTKLNRFSFAWALFSEAILLATLSCREPSVIIALMAVATVPPWIEMRSRGHSTRVYSWHMGLFVLLLTGGWLLSPAAAPGPGEAVAITTLLAGAMLTAAALLRSGIVPVHCWMTDLFEKATFGTALLYVAPMTGAYVVMRIVLPIAPSWALHSIAIVSLITAVYAAGMALVQTDARRFYCYLFLSHSSLVLVGLELVTPIGLTGALCVWLSVGLSLGGFGLSLRCVEARMGKISLKRFLGLYDHSPTLAVLFLITGLASIGFPGTIGFIGAELLVEGAVGVYPLVGFAVVLAAALNGIAVMWVYFRIFTGAVHTAPLSLSVRPVERIAVLILAALIIGGGLVPQPGVASRYHAAVELMRRRGDAPTEASVEHAAVSWFPQRPTIALETAPEQTRP